MECPEYSPDWSPIGPEELKDGINIKHAVRSAGICRWYKFHGRPCFPFISSFYCNNGFEEPYSPKKEKNIEMRRGRDYYVDKQGKPVLYQETVAKLERIKTGKRAPTTEKFRIGGPAPEPGDKRIWYKTEEDYLMNRPANVKTGSSGSSGGSGGTRGVRKSYEFNCDDCGILWSLKVNRAGPKYCKSCIERRRKEGTGPRQGG